MIPGIFPPAETATGYMTTNKKGYSVLKSSSAAQMNSHVEHIHLGCKNPGELFPQGQRTLKHKTGIKPTTKNRILLDC